MSEDDKIVRIPSMQIVLVITVISIIQNKHAKFSKCKNHNISTIRSGRNVISTELSMEFILLVNAKMPTFVGILTFLSRITSG